MQVPKDAIRLTKVRRNKSSLKCIVVHEIRFHQVNSIGTRCIKYCLSQVFDFISPRREKIRLHVLILDDNNAQPHQA